MEKDNSHSADDFLDARNDSDRGLFAELLYFVKNNKKWWLLPIILVIVGMGLLITLGGSAAAPFIYSLF